MRRIVIDMQNTLFADAVAEALRNFDSDLEPIMSESPDKTLSLCEATLANVLIMEVTAYTAWGLEERLKIRSLLQKTTPSCKVVLVVDENTEKSWQTGCVRPKRMAWWITLFTALFLPAISPPL